MPEIDFKPIPGFEGLYAANPKGFILSLSRKLRFVSVKGKECFRVSSPKLLRAFPDCYGYLTVCLRKDKSNQVFTVHRLIALVFLGPSELDVNHKDGNKQNNELENLEYCTRSENGRHAWRIGLMKKCFSGQYPFQIQKEATGEANMTMAELILWGGAAGLAVLVFSIPASLGIVILRAAILALKDKKKQ